ncbi:MAG TPA: DedA family protein [Clostridia bacterium]|nr:DedA family protein [Clostridia bacterium]
MSGIQLVIEVFLHLDKHLGTFMGQYGVLAYVALFLIIFCETGLVVTPFLPGDSLIFAAGALAAAGIMTPYVVLLLIAAAILGNTVNYEIGRFLSEKIQRRENIRFIKMEYIDRTHRFFEKYGGITIIITRFVPIIRTFSPFVAGVGKMPYKRFLSFNAIGGISWATLFFVVGYFFGNLPFVKSHFSFIVIGIILVSLLPAVIAFFKARQPGKKQEEEE